MADKYAQRPAILKLLEDISKKTILDLGCGSGKFSQILANKGAKVDAADISEEWIKKAKSKFKEVNFFTADSSNLNMIKDNTYDIVLMKLVFLNIKDKEKVEKTFHEVSRVLKNGGDFIFTDLHPLCLMIKDTGTERQNHLENFSYFKDGSQFKSDVLMSDEKTRMQFTDTHWTLNTYTRLINESDLVINQIIEPEPIKESPEAIKNTKVPEFIIFHCKKK